jgi:hypothetical protein
MKRSKLNPISKDPAKRARRFVPQSVINLVKQRSGGICEFIDKFGIRCQVPAERTPHHLLNRSQGGKHTVENLRDSCWHHNEFAKKHPDYAKALGWHIPYEGYKFNL